MKSKYPKEYSNLKKMDIKVLKRRNELSSSASADNTLLDLHNSSYHTQPHPIIANCSR